MEKTEATFSKQWKLNKLSQWLILTASLITLQLVAGGPFMPHIAAFAAMIATLISMVLLFIMRFVDEILSLFTLGGVVIGVLIIMGFLYGGYMIVVVAAIIALGGTHWVGVLVPEIVPFAGQYWILLMSLAFEIGMSFLNLDLVSRAARMLPMNQEGFTARME